MRLTVCDNAAESGEVPLKIGTRLLAEGPIGPTLYGSDFRSDLQLHWTTRGEFGASKKRIWGDERGRTGFSYTAATYVSPKANAAGHISGTVRHAREPCYPHGGRNQRNQRG